MLTTLPARNCVLHQQLDCGRRGRQLVGLWAAVAVCRATRRQPVDLCRRLITACTVVQCSTMDDSAFLWEHAIFGPPPRRNPLTDRYEILHN
jgi:hypothetical protein